MSLSSSFSRTVILSTARRFLLKLGFSGVDVGIKGVCIDGHERVDVLKEREIS